MAYQSLYRRYRPRRFEELKGQEHVVRALRNAVRDDRVGHAYLFSGPRGTGKTSAARILAKVLNCEQPTDGEPCLMCASCVAVEAGTSYDVHELDAASNRGIDDIREIIGRAALGTPGRRKVYILDEVHMLTAPANAALLKILEEPPSHVVFVLATTEPEKVGSTVRSRTQHLQFNLLPVDELEQHVRWVVADAGLDVSDDAIEAILRQGAGSARDTLSALEQVVAAGGVAPDEEPLDDVVEALIARDTAGALAGVAAATAAGRAARTLAERLVAQLRDAFLSLFAPELVDLPDRAAERVADQAKRLGPAATVRAIEVLGDTLVEFRHTSDPRLLLDVALVRLTNDAADPSPEALLARLERLERQASSGSSGAGSAGISSSGTGTGSGTASGTTSTGRAPSPPAKASAPPAASTTAAPTTRPSMPTRPAGSAKTPPERATITAEIVEQEAAAPAPPEPQQATASADPSDVPTRDQLTMAWGDHVLPKLKGMARALYSPGRFVESDSGQAVFALPPTHPMHRCEPLRPDVEAALATYFGHAVPLRLVVDHGQTARPPRPADVAGDELVDESVDEPVDLAELVEARPADIPSSAEQLAKAFPGAEIVEETGAP